MELIRGVANLQQQITACVATIGNFDGIHLGHRAIITRVIDKARELGLPAYVLLFEPHPKEFFLDEHCPPRLTCFREKYKLLQKLGIDRLVVLPFNRSMRNMTASDFVRILLINKLKVKHLVVGDDFRFGHRRLGNFQLLEKMAADYYTLEPTSSVMLDRHRVSSTLIRAALADGDLNRACSMLGRQYSMTGRVGYGMQLGQSLGFPTVNIALKRRKSAVKGVFLVKCYWRVNGVRHSAWGVANCGFRPTVGGQVDKLEVHLLGVCEALYGIELLVEFLVFIRKERKFDHLDDLKRQISQDVTHAKQLVAYF